MNTGEVHISDDRKYLAVSIKHTEYRWKYGKPLVLWGYKRTDDNEERCFADYTEKPSKAELYALGDFTAHGYNQYWKDMKDDEPVDLLGDIRFCKTWKKWDTVLVLEEDYLKYCAGCGIEI